MGKAKRVVDINTMFEAGRWLAVKIIQRTQDGKDEEGRRFKPYSPGYARWKNVSRPPRANSAGMRSPVTANASEVECTEAEQIELEDG